MDSTESASGGSLQKNGVYVLLLEAGVEKSDKERKKLQVVININNVLGQ